MYPSPNTSVIWFEADQAVSQTIVPPATSDYLTTTGGAIVAVVPSTVADHYLIRGYVPASDPFTSNSTLVELSSTQCGLLPACTSATYADNAPVCNIYAVDLSYCGTEGLVTVRSQAQLVLVCSEPVSGLCSPAVDTCIEVAGPANSTVQYVDLISSTDSYYNTLVSWDADYLGPISVTFTCDLVDSNGYSLASAIQSVDFTVIPVVAVRSSAYKIGDQIVSIGGPGAAPMASPAPAPTPAPNDNPAR